MEYHEKCLADGSRASAFFCAGGADCRAAAVDVPFEYGAVYPVSSPVDSAESGAVRMAEQLSVPSVF